MPLLEIRIVAENRRLGIFKITEDHDTLLHSIFPQLEDMDLFQTYSHPQKKKEWLAARILLNLLCNDCGIAYTGIVKDQNGKPHLKDRNYEISLSHSFPFVVIIMDPIYDVGIDLEEPKPKLLTIARRFLNNDEQQLAGSDIHKLCTFWCAKEALYKIYSKKGLNFHDQIFLYPDGSFPWKRIKGIIKPETEAKKFNLKCESLEGFTVVYNI